MVLNLNEGLFKSSLKVLNSLAFAQQPALPEQTSVYLLIVHFLCARHVCGLPTFNPCRHLWHGPEKPVLQMRLR